MLGEEGREELARHARREDERGHEAHALRGGGGGGRGEGLAKFALHGGSLLACSLPLALLKLASMHACTCNFLGLPMLAGSFDPLHELLEAWLLVMAWYSGQWCCTVEQCAAVRRGAARASLTH